MPAHQYPNGYRLRVVYNKKFGMIHLCHNQWCNKGETSIVTTMMNGLDTAADLAEAEALVHAFNYGRERLEQEPHRDPHHKPDLNPQA